MENPVNNRNRYFDFIRGVAIMMVVAIHTFKVNDVNYETFSGYIILLIRQILNCAVPLFLALSGYFITSKLAKLPTKENRNQYLLKQIKKVYIPTLIFSIPYFLQTVLYDNITYKIVIYNIIVLLICGYGVYYYIALIIQCYIMAPALYKYNPTKLLIISSIISICSILCVTFLNASHVNLPLIIYAGPIILWIVFFTSGMYIQKCKRNYPLWAPLFILSCGLILSMVESYYWADKGTPIYGIKLSSFIFSVGVIFFVFSPRTEFIFKSNYFTKAIVDIGEVSFGIYLIHLMLINIMHIYIYLDSWLLEWSIVLGVSYFIIKGLNLCIPDNYHRLLGLP